MTLGVHFAIDAETADRLLAATSDDEVTAVVEEIEEEGTGLGSCDTDKAWDAIHRSLTDGRLSYDNGSYPLNAVVLGGAQLHEEDDYVVSLLTPDQVREVADATAAVDPAALRAGYDRIDVEDYGPEFGDEDFAYTWSNFADLAAFFREAADAGSHVIFTVGL
ncbi:YfbM family protein [Kitasatospora sp. NPDC051853]|uniref:YfbM family protein n=1 Tax=Kitasatospora sp. NPDC051853 TaxID=3364058 RepID=UPI0037B0E7D4